MKQKAKSDIILKTRRVRHVRVADFDEFEDSLRTELAKQIDAITDEDGSVGVNAEIMSHLERDPNGYAQVAITSMRWGSYLGLVYVKGWKDTGETVY